MIIIAFLLLLLACVADAATTSALIARGGVENNLAWLIGRRPSPTAVYLTVAVVPIALCALVLASVPTWWPAVLAIAAWRGYQARRNHRLMRS